jgi:2-polyprenyl-6-methoxyphenol hydroxylase-like FAD-dependent oxidoreductase
MTEQMLETFLNENHVKVERNTEAIDLLDMDSTGGPGVRVTLSNGEIIQTKYVCACDGARSTVRHKLNLLFSGRTYSESIFVADCQVNNLPIGKNEFAIFCESTGLAGIFPINNDRYRLIGTISEGKEEDMHINFNDAATIFKTRTRHSDINISNCNWISVYHSHHRHITTFQCRKRYFLLGDAAHIHSPVGGQGMNTGLQDAHNLAWKLAYVLTHSANDYLLDTYHDERSTVAKTLVNTTDKMFSFVSSPHWLTRFIRLYIAPYLLRFFIQPIYNSSHNIRQLFFRRISQLGITYCSSTVYDYGASAGSFHRNTPLPGDRFPYVIFDPCHYHLVIFENQQSAKLNLFVELIKRQYSEIIKIHDIHEENFPFRFEGAILIRPDGYIAYRTTVFDIHHFQSYFAQFFIKQ